MSDFKYWLHGLVQETTNDSNTQSTCVTPLDLSKVEQQVPLENHKECTNNTYMQPAGRFIKRSIEYANTSSPLPTYGQIMTPSNIAPVTKIRASPIQIPHSHRNISPEERNYRKRPAVTQYFEDDRQPSSRYVKHEHLDDDEDDPTFYCNLAYFRAQKRKNTSQVSNSEKQFYPSQQLQQESQIRYQGEVFDMDM